MIFPRRERRAAIIARFAYPDLAGEIPMAPRAARLPRPPDRDAEGASFRPETLRQKNGRS
jgi:hypothetical protein